jgi:2-(1,2-epoxy-1,2-dihydrophenyl)acetyl-CoA isomerase
VNGVAAGAGANLALACDIVLAASEASFIQSFTKIGLIPDSGGTYLLPRLVGMARASALMLLGDKISATQARDWGLIWQVCDDGTVLEQAMALAAKLATQPTRAFGLTKRLLNASLDHDLATQLAMEADVQREAGKTGDFLEGVQAFLQKRKPAFEGR